jgi:hypothetical protein
VSNPELTPPRAPSLWDVVVETQRFMVYGSAPPRRRNLVFPLVLIAALALIAPKVGSTGVPSTLIVLVLAYTAFSAYRVGTRQQALGRSTVHTATAVLTAVGSVAALVGAFVTLSLIIGPAPEDSLLVKLLGNLMGVNP